MISCQNPLTRNLMSSVCLTLLGNIILLRLLHWWINCEESCTLFPQSFESQERTSLIQYLVSDQIRSVAQSCLTLCNTMNHSTSGLPVHHQIPEFTETHVHQVSDAIQPSHPLSPLLLLPPIPPSIRVFSNESILLMRWPKNWSFSFNIIPSKEIPGMISFRMHWLDLLAFQGTLKSLLQHHSSKASILWHQPSSQSNCHIHTWSQEKHSFD